MSDQAAPSMSRIEMWFDQQTFSHHVQCGIHRTTIHDSELRESSLPGALLATRAAFVDLPAVQVTVQADRRPDARPGAHTVDVGDPDGRLMRFEVNAADTDRRLMDRAARARRDWAD